MLVSKSAVDFTGRSSMLCYVSVFWWSDGRVVSNFIMQALSGEDITIYGDGGQTRSFCYVDDLIEGLIRLMNNETEVSLEQSIFGLASWPAATVVKDCLIERECFYCTALMGCQRWTVLKDVDIEDVTSKR